MSYEQARRIDPRDLKPGRLWYWIAAAIIVVGVGAGITVFVLGVSTIVGNIPDMKQGFGSGEATSVELSDEQEWAIYVDAPGDSPPSVECTAESSDGEATLSSSSERFTFSNGAEQWQLVYDVKVSKSGEYTFTCDSDETVGKFAVGDAADVGGFVGGVFGSIGGLIGIPCFSLVVGGVIILVVAMRRSSHKKRLISEAARPQGPGAW